MRYKIYNQDVLDWAKQYGKGKFHAMLCDPPYHLTTITKRFGKNGSAPAQYGTDGAFARASAGFMGQTWDGGDVAFRPETWAALGEHLYPGAFGMAFSASRNWHRLAVAIEDAGLIIHPTIFGWLQGQGFPKATRVKDERFDGHRYGLQALKPSVEPIIVFQKPYEGRPLDNITKTGAGALNIDAGRIGVDGGGTQCDNRDDKGNCLGHPSANGSLGGGVMRHAKLETRIINRFTDGAKPWGNGAGHEFETERTMQGRWPANFLLDDVTAPMLNAQTGTLTSGIPSGKKHAENNIYGQYKNDDVDVTGYGDAGGASRFFYNVTNQIDEADPIYYCSKVPSKERNAGLDDLPEIEMSYMNTHNGNPKEGETWHPVDDRTGKERDRFKSKARNPHPTVKPIDLATYLAKLLLPPDEYAPRRILVPFSGVGSEMIGCAKAGWEQIVGIEFDTKNGYVEIAKKRIEHWCK